MEDVPQTEITKHLRLMGSHTPTTKTTPIYLLKHTEASLNYLFRKKIESHRNTFGKE